MNMKRENTILLRSRNTKLLFKKIVAVKFLSILFINLYNNILVCYSCGLPFTVVLHECMIVMLVQSEYIKFCLLYLYLALRIFLIVWFYLIAFSSLHSALNYL